MEGAPQHTYSCLTQTKLRKFKIVKLYTIFIDTVNMNDHKVWWYLLWYFSEDTFETFFPQTTPVLKKY